MIVQLIPRIGKRLLHFIIHFLHFLFSFFPSSFFFSLSFFILLLLCLGSMLFCFAHPLGVVLFAHANQRSPSFLRVHVNCTFPLPLALSNSRILFAVVRKSNCSFLLFRGTSKIELFVSPQFGLHTRSLIVPFANVTNYLYHMFAFA